MACQLEMLTAQFVVEDARPIADTDSSTACSMPVELSGAPDATNVDWKPF